MTISSVMGQCLSKNKTTMENAIPVKNNRFDNTKSFP